MTTKQPTFQERIRLLGEVAGSLYTFANDTENDLDAGALDHLGNIVSAEVARMQSAADRWKQDNLAKGRLPKTKNASAGRKRFSQRR